MGDMQDKKYIGIKHKQHADCIADMCACNYSGSHCGGDLVVMLAYNPETYRTEYCFRCPVCKNRWHTPDDIVILDVQEVVARADEVIKKEAQNKAQVFEVPVERR